MEKNKRLYKRKERKIGEDDRNFLNAVFWILRTGAPWRDLPPDYGKWYTVHKRFIRWAKNGKWERLAKVLSQNAELKNVVAMIDSSYIKVHIYTTGAKKNNQDIGHTKGGSIRKYT